MQVNFHELLFRSGRHKARKITAEPTQLKTRLCVSGNEELIQLDLAGHVLRLCPESPGGQTPGASKNWVLFDPERYFCEISGFTRIGCGKTLLVGRDNEQFDQLFACTSKLKKRHLEIENVDGVLVFERLDPDAETSIRRIEDPDEIARSLIDRRKNLGHVRKIFGGPIELLSSDAAVGVLQDVNKIVRDAAHRAKDAKGRPGGLVDLPDKYSPIIVGDLHAQIDNLLKVLSEPPYLDALSRGDACLILLGDAIHSEIDGELEHMHTSLLMLDLIFKLIIRFPKQVVYLRGNHESFDAEVAKDGIPQGILFRKYIKELRGRLYVDELQTFFDLQPYVVFSNDFIACHGGPPRGETTVQELTEIADHGALAHELTWNRLRSPRAPAGYRKKDVKRLRAALGRAKKTPVVVGHNPLSQIETIWTDAGDIRNHHIVFSAHKDRLALFTRVNGHMLPLEYPVEPLLELANKI